MWKMVTFMQALAGFIIMTNSVPREVEPEEFQENTSAGISWAMKKTRPIRLFNMFQGGWNHQLDMYIYIHIFKTPII